MSLAQRALGKTLLGHIAGAVDFDNARPAILQQLKDFLARERDVFEQRIRANPAEAAPIRHEYAQLADELLIVIYRLISDHVHPASSKENNLALIAVGGYGRNEMAPHSDIDILFLLPDTQTKWHEDVVQTILYLLWDLGLKVGQAVRSADECLQLAAEDYTIRTAMLEQRFLVGDAKLAEYLVERLRRELFEKTVADFTAEKLTEREARHNKSGNTRYVLEPNVKEAKGGLRDLQTLYWLGKYMTGSETPEDLATQGFFRPQELAEFRTSEDFLWDVRMMLHLINGRANDVLSFDMQVEVANAFGYRDNENRRAVEGFMQDYFRAARQVGELTRVFITELEARNAKNLRSRLGDMFKNRNNLPDAFVYENGRINFSDEAAIIEDPLNILRIFAIALDADVLIHPNAFRYMARHHELIDDNFCNSKEANRIFMSLLLDFGNPERVLRRMNEIGLLGQFIPEWARIDAMMQYNMYHSYTVDEHTIRCISHLSDIEHELLIEDLPVASRILKRGVNRRVIYIALLMHDIGKGLARPHEEVGAEIARKLGPRFGLESFEVEIVEWLVLHHLDMSDAAQKRDISDPATIWGFSELVQDQERLDLLTVLTVCDIRGVGPNTWNNWKAVLLRQLHSITSGVLTEGGKLSGMAAREEAAKKALATLLVDWEAETVEYELDRHYPEYWLGLTADIHLEFAQLLQLPAEEAPHIHLAPDSDRDATRICFVLPDHPGIFARLCGAMSLSGANIVDARSYTSSDGMATAVFWLQDDSGSCYSMTRQTGLRKNVLNILHGELVTGDALAARSKIKKRERAFKVPTKINFDNKGSQIFTIIEIDTRDRKGLLFDLTRAMASASISISTAIIATYGEQAVDSFYVKDVFGMKIKSEHKQKVIADKIRKAIEDGYKEAIK